MSDIVQRLRESFTVYGVCDFDTLINEPELRENEAWQDVALAADAIAEIERLRGVLKEIYDHFGPPQDDCECFMCELQRERATSDEASAAAISGAE